jgi:hypothetical protein
MCTHRSSLSLPLALSGAGKRMTLQDWYECPSCRMPCSSRSFLDILAAEGNCPMCSAAVSMQDVRQVPDPLSSVAKS